MDIQRQRVFQRERICLVIDPEKGIPDLRDDLDFLSSKGLIEVVGVDPEGEWLYGLSPSSQALIDNSDSEDPYSVISKLIEETKLENRNEK